MTKHLLLVSCLVLLSSLARHASGAESTSLSAEDLMGEIWLSLDGEWQEPPKIPGSAERDEFQIAPATLLVFSSHRQFAMIECWISSDDRLEISRSRGQKIYIGTWDLPVARIETRFRLFYETTPPAGGGDPPGPEEEATALPVDRALHFRGKVFEPAQAHDFDGSEKYLPPYRFNDCDPEKASGDCRIEGLP